MKRILAILTIVATVGGNASAQDRVREDGLYYRVGIGATTVSDWAQDLTFNSGLGGILPCTGSCPVTPISLPNGNLVTNGEGFVAGAAIGFDYADGIRTELEYRYASSNIEGVTQTAPAGALSVLALPPVGDRAGAHFIMANFFFDIYNDSPITPFIGAGVGGALVTNQYGDQDAAIAYQGRAGLSFAVGGGFSADLEYIYTRTNKLVFGPRLDTLAATAPILPNVSGDYYESSSVMISMRKPF